MFEEIRECLRVVHSVLEIIDSSAIDTRLARIESQLSSIQSGIKRQDRMTVYLFGIGICFSAIAIGLSIGIKLTPEGLGCK